MADDADPGPFFYRPDPDVSRWIMAKPERLERRGPSDFRIIGRGADGRPVEARLAPLSFSMRGI